MNTVICNTYQVLFRVNAQNYDETLGDVAEKWEMDSKGLTSKARSKVCLWTEAPGIKSRK